MPDLCIKSVMSDIHTYLQSLEPCKLIEAACSGLIKVRLKLRALHQLRMVQTPALNPILPSAI